MYTYSMVQSPSWEGNWFAATQEIPRISRNPKVHYRTHKPPPPVSILGQPNPVQIPTSHLLEIHPNIIHPSTPGSPHWSLSLRPPKPRPYTPPLHTLTRHMPSPSHSRACVQLLLLLLLKTQHTWRTILGGHEQALESVTSSERQAVKPANEAKDGILGVTVSRQFQ